MALVSLGQRISEYRIKRGWSQFDLAEKVGMSTSSIGMWETDKRDPNSQMIVKLANVFNITCDELLGNQEKIPDTQHLITQTKNDPEIQSFIEEFLNSPHDKRDELLRFWNFINQKK